MIESAAQFTELWDTQRPGGWLGSDGTWTIKHPTWDATLFWNGDTALESAVGERTMPHHTLVVYENTHENLRITSKDLVIVPPQAGNWYWGGEMVWDGPDLWSFATRIGPDPTNAWGFNQLGRDLVHICWPVHRLPYAEITAFYDTTSVWGDVDWGAGMYSTHEWTYVFGIYYELEWANKWVFGNRVYLARARPGNLDMRRRWEYFTTDGWRVSPRLSPMHDELKTVIDETAGPANAFSVDFDRGLYKLVSKLHGDFGAEVAVWESETPIGPWTPRKLFDAPWSEEDNTYGARAHFDLPPTLNGTTLVSVNHNRTGASLASFYESPYFYRPTYHEVAL